MDADDLVACLEYYRDQRGLKQVWGGTKDRPHKEPSEPEVRWWCEHIVRDGGGRVWRSGPPMEYGGTQGWHIWTAKEELVAAGRIREVKRNRRTYFELVDSK